MPTPESKIKEAILHPEEEIRLYAVDYFSAGRCGGESIMPLVIQAVEKYGRETAFDILLEAAPLPQTAATIDWIVEELRREYDPSDVRRENNCFALAWILNNAPPPLLRKRRREILAAPAFPQPLRQSFTDRLKRSALEWEEAWTSLKNYGLDVMRHGFTPSSFEWRTGAVEALARHRHKADKVLELLQDRYGGEDPCLICWLRSSFVDLAGAMRLTEAVPLLMDLLDKDLSGNAQIALTRIGGEAVLRAIDARWWRGGPEFRSVAADMLVLLRGDYCIDRCLAFLKKERVTRIKWNVANALLANFCAEAVAPVRQFIAAAGEKRITRFEPDLRHHLVAVGTILGTTFPEFDEWRALALHDNWGRLDLPLRREVDRYKPEDFGPQWSEN